MNGEVKHVNTKPLVAFRNWWQTKRHTENKVSVWVYTLCNQCLLHYETLQQTNVSLTCLNRNYRKYRTGFHQNQRTVGLGPEPSYLFWFGADKWTAPFIFYLGFFFFSLTFPVTSQGIIHGSWWKNAYFRWPVLYFARSHHHHHHHPWQ